MKTKNPIVRLTGQASVVALLACLAVPVARGANAYWGAVPGVSADTNWSDAANWPEPPGGWSYSNGGDGPTFYNEVFFNGVGANAINNFAVNNVLDTTSSGAAVMPVWELDFTPTNGNYTTLINPGVTLQIAAGNGNVRVGADSQHTTSAAPANAVETIKFEGPGAAFTMSGNLYVGQGSVTPNDTHNVTFDLSGLDNFVMTANGNYIYLASSAAANANGVLYLAKTNNIALGNGIQMCNGASNSQPVELFLGINNSITLGSSGNFNVGQTGTTTNGAILEFNPAFLGGATPPTAVFNSAASGGRINDFYVGNANQTYAANAVCNLSGGSINALISTLQVALAGGAGAVTGALTCDMGTLNANSANVAVQGSSGGGMAVGTVNINSNSTYGASASLVVNGTLSIASVTGTVTPGTAGTININGGALSAGTIVNGTGVGTVNVAGGTLTLSGAGGTAASPISDLVLSNSTVNLTISTAPTNIFAGALTVNGATNVINITAAPLFSSYPATISLIKYQGSIGGSFNIGLGTLPNLYVGHLANNTGNGSVDLILTSGPSAETWTDGAGNNNWDTTSANWSGATTKYVDGDAVQFLDGAASGLVNLTGTFMPNSMIVSNNALAYTWSSGGAVSGSASLTKKGPGTFVIDNTGNNNFAGGVTISGGILQVGNSDTSGNLPGGTVTDNGVLVFDRTDSDVNNNTITGSGAVVEAGGGTLQLAGGNTFSGPVVATNNSTLQLSGSTAAGTGTNDIIIASGSTLDVNGNTATKPVIISGTGVGGNGALIDSGGAIYDNPGPAVATNITLAADTTFVDNSPNRWDLGSRNGTTCVLGGAYNLTINGNGYFEWANLQVNNIENITLTSGTMGVIGNTSFGNPAYTLTVTASSALQFYGANNFVNKAVDLQNGATINNSANGSVMTGPMTLEPGVENLNIGSGTSLTLSNSLSGLGFLVQNTGTGSSVLAGNSPSFTGGVVLYTGQTALNGLIGSGITSSSGTTISGTGTADGLVDVSGAFIPGSASTAGTFNAAGGLTIESGATMTMNLGTTTTPGGGTNALVNVTGNLTFNANNFNISINPYKGYLANGTYTLFNYTGTLTVSGSLTASPASPSVYTFTIVTNATQVLLTVSGQGNLVAWNNNGNNGQWDVSTSVNWTNHTTLTNTVYLNPDSVVFDDTITNAVHPTTSITIPSGTVVVPAVITNNSTTNYTISGSGQIAGGASIVKLGSSTLTISSANTFDGNTIIGAGALQISGQVGTATTPLGPTNGSIIISNGATLYVNLTGGYPAGDAGFAGKPIIVSGAGVNGQGAIQNIGNALYDDGSTLGLGFNLTLAGNATIGGSSRLDWGYPGTGTTLSSSGSNYNLSVIENQYFRWDNFSIDTNLGNIDVSDSSSSGYTWELDGMGASLGNPTNVLTVHSNVQMEITDSSVGSYPLADDSGYAKVIHVQPTAAYVNEINGGSGDYRDSTSFILDGGSLFNYYNGTGGNNSGTAFSGTVLLNGLVNFEVGNSLLTFSNVISGTGGFYISNYGGNPPMCLAAVNTYTGTTDLRGGTCLSLIGSGSISDSTPISLATGALLITTNRVDGTLTLASGQTLEGIGTVQGNLAAGAGSTILPGITSTSTNEGNLSVTGNATLAGDVLVKLTNSTSDSLTVGGAVAYGGTLTVNNLSATPLAAGNSFKLFTAASYSGAFSSISPATPGAGLFWNTNNLTVNGTLSVGSPSGPKITSIAVKGTTLTIVATNGPANGQFVLMDSTNLLRPLPWTPVLTNNFGNNGVLNLSTNIIQANTPDEYYILQVAQ